MARTKNPELTTNVYVDGTWYGPDYPDNKVTAEVREQITNPAAYEPVPVGVDNRFRADDFGEQDTPSMRAEGTVDEAGDVDR